MAVDGDFNHPDLRRHHHQSSGLLRSHHPEWNADHARTHGRGCRTGGTLVEVFLREAKKANRAKRAKVSIFLPLLALLAFSAHALSVKSPGDLDVVFSPPVDR